MAWRRQSLRHSIAARKGWIKRKIKKRVKRYVIRKAASTAAGVPGADEILEANETRD